MDNTIIHELIKMQVCTTKIFGQGKPLIRKLRKINFQKNSKKLLTNFEKIAKS